MCFVTTDIECPVMITHPYVVICCKHTVLSRYLDSIVIDDNTVIKGFQLYNIRNLLQKVSLHTPTNRIPIICMSQACVSTLVAMLKMYNNMQSFMRNVQQHAHIPVLSP
jgi:hypothetical protein